MKAGNYHGHDHRLGREASPGRPKFVQAWKAKFPMSLVPQFAVISEDGGCRWWNEWPDGKTRCLAAGTFEITDELISRGSIVEIGNSGQYIQAHEVLEID